MECLDSEGRGVGGRQAWKQTSLLLDQLKSLENLPAVYLHFTGDEGYSDPVLQERWGCCILVPVLLSLWTALLP